MEYEQRNVVTTLTDAVAMIWMNDAKSVHTYGEHSKTEIGDKVWFILDGVQDLHIIFNVYSNESPKKENHEDCN